MQILNLHIYFLHFSGVIIRLHNCMLSLRSKLKPFNWGCAAKIDQPYGPVISGQVNVVQYEKLETAY